MTPSSENFERDIDLALTLLGGQRIERKGAPELQQLSAHTQPTEKEARLALYRVLTRMSRDYLADRRDPRRYLLILLACVFAPSEVRGDSRRLKAVLQWHNQGHRNSRRDSVIVSAVSQLRDGGLSYHKATEAAAIKFGKSQDHVKRLYGRHKRDLDDIKKQVEQARKQFERVRSERS